MNPRCLLCKMAKESRDPNWHIISTVLKDDRFYRHLIAKDKARKMQKVSRLQVRLQFRPQELHIHKEL
jgi:hypothetical protein